MPILAEQPPLVLIATLNAPARVALARLVTRRGMTALACFDGAAALAYAHAQRPEVWGAIIAPHLPSIDGASLARALRDEVEGVDTFVLGMADGEDGHGLPPDEITRVDAWLERLVLAWPTAQHAGAWQRRTA